MVATYRLPQLQSTVTGVSFMCRSDPTPSFSISQPSSSFTYPPFFHDPSDQLVSLTIDVEGPDPTVASWSSTLFLLSKTLLQRVPARQTPAPTIVGWEAWGLNASRFLADVGALRGYACYIYGYKYAYIPHTCRGRFLHVLNFNPYATSRPFPAALKTGDSGGAIAADDKVWAGENVTSTGVVHGSTIEKAVEYSVGFSEDVTTTLPYRATMLVQRLQHRYIDVMIDAERIIGVLVRCLLKLRSLVLLKHS